MDIEIVARTAIDCGFRLHKDLGPGLLEGVYEISMAEALRDAGLHVARQVTVPVEYRAWQSTTRFALICR